MITVQQSEKKSCLENAIDSYVITEEQGTMTLFEPLKLESNDGHKKKKNSKRRSHQIDIDSFVSRQKTYPASKKDILGRVAGRKTETILDATAGWGSDALHLCSQGFTLQLVERNPILVGFLSEALSRLERSTWVKNNTVIVPKLLAVDSIQMMRESAFIQSVDCIYLDPMFPEKRKRSALAKKNMQVLHDLLGEDDDQEHLFSAAYAASKRRIVVKRPDYAQSLGASLGIEPSQILQSKLIHYEIYLKH